MALPGSGVLGVSDIVDEFGGSAPHGLSEYYRGGGLVSDSPSNTGVPTSGTIAIGDFYGAASAVLVNITIASNTNNYDLYTAVSANPAYVPGATTITATINPGVTVGSTSTGTYAFSVPNAFGAGDIITVVNNGTVLGAGGSGGAGSSPPSSPSGNLPAQPGFTAGNAVYVNRPITINNAGTLAGAGGGGGASGAALVQTGTTPKGGPNISKIGGAGGGGGAGVNPGAGGGFSGSGGSAGSSGSSTAGGAGGPRYTGSPATWWRGAGGTGGARGANGSAGEPDGPANPNTASQTWNPGAGGGAGRYMTGNPFVTWSATGTRQGGVS